MFDQNIHRLGFCCKYMHHDQSLPKNILAEKQRPLNTRTTTLSWLRAQDKDVSTNRLVEIAEHNIRSAFNLVDYVSSLPTHRRMVRLSSDLLTAYTAPEWKNFWLSKEMQSLCESGFASIGDLARERDVRLSFHPGQFTVLASSNPQVVENSIEEFEYHAQMARWMGYGKEFQDMKINVHIAGGEGPEGIIRALKRLSPEARNTITIENDETRWGIDASLELADHVALVLDIHHHWVREGVYIKPTDKKFLRVIESWRGVRPAIHYSVSKRNAVSCSGFDGKDIKPSKAQILKNGGKVSSLRAHSDRYWNEAVNEWAMTFLPYADIQCESKLKNLATQELCEKHLTKELLGENQVLGTEPTSVKLFSESLV